MATVSDITTTPLSGLNHIDALLDTGPDWNFLTPAGNALYYTFSILSGNEAGQTGQEAFTLAQQVATRTAFDYISKLTGIQFVETVSGSDAQIHLCNTDLQGANVTGLCSWHSSYTYSGANLVGYEADAYVYLDDVEWFSQNHNLTPGGYGYETLLHELGHALGLKHPFDDSIHLPSSQDNTNNTLMSYTSTDGPHSTYSQYDIAALKWLYGMDGLGGALGINSTTGARYITGTSGTDTLTGTAANDTLEGDGGNDMIDGGSGTDTAVFRGVRSNYTINALANGDLTVTSRDGIDGTDTLRSIEILKFSDMSASRADVVAAAADVTAPNKPTLVVTKNVAGYAIGNTPLVNGQGEIGATIKIYTSDNKQVGTATVDANGLWQVKLAPLADGKDYHIFATATDAANNVSVASDMATFHVDATPPVSPTYSQFYTAGSNQISFTGTAEAGSLIELVRTVGGLQTIAHTTTDASGTWRIDSAPLPNGSYTVSVTSTDISGNNATTAKTSPTWTVNSTPNITGTAGADVLKPGADNNAVDGGAGIDTAVYTGSHNDFIVTKADWGFDVVDKTGSNGHDSLINVERIQFDDGYLAVDVGINGSAGQLYRLYSAAFGREPDAVGMGYWLSRMEHGATLPQVSKEFMVGGDGTGQAEFVKMYGSNSSNATFLTTMYHNILGREPDADGYKFWLDALNGNLNPDKTAFRAQLMIDFSQSPENLQKVQLVGTLDHGVEFVPYYGV
jgi:hypothetical protein